MQKFHCSERDSERQPPTMGDSDGHAVTPLNQRDSEKKPATIGESERCAETPWYSVRDSQQL